MRNCKFCTNYKGYSYNGSTDEFYIYCDCKTNKFGFDSCTEFKPNYDFYVSLNTLILFRNNVDDENVKKIINNYIKVNFGCL